MFSTLLVKVGVTLALTTVGGVAAVAAISSGDPSTRTSSEARRSVDVEGARGTQGEEGHATGEAKREGAEAYAFAVREWTDCVADATATRGDRSTREEGAFDPHAECGDRPDPTDFGLTEPPAQAEQGRGESEGAGTAGREAHPGSTPTREQTPPAYAPEPEQTSPSDPGPEQTSPAGQPTPPHP